MLSDDGFGGTYAYKKASFANSLSGCKFLYYEANKKRWKISNLLGDKNGFAYIKVSDGGNRPPVDPGVGVTWSVFDGKARGFNQDEAVQCRWHLDPNASSDSVEPFVLSTAAPSAPTASEEPTASPSVGAHTATASVDPTMLASADADDQKSEGDASSDSSDSDDNSEESDSSEEVGSDKEDISEAEGTIRSAVQNLETIAVSNFTRICAKMLVHCGVRCACHFAYLHDCPVHKPV
jgi:hypothetical protein